MYIKHKVIILIKKNWIKVQLVKYKGQKAALIKNSHDDINVHIWQRKKKCIVQRKKSVSNQLVQNVYKP